MAVVMVAAAAVTVTVVPWGRSSCRGAAADARRGVVPEHGAIPASLPDFGREMCVDQQQYNKMVVCGFRMLGRDEAMGIIRDHCALVANNARDREARRAGGGGSGGRGGGSW